MLKSQLDYRLSLLFDNRGDVALKTGEIYIFTQPIKDQNIPQGYRVVLTSFDPKNGTVEMVKEGPGAKEPIVMNINDFNKAAMTEDTLNNLPDDLGTYQPNAEELDHITESMSFTSDELSDLAQLAKWNEEASAENISLDNLKDDFFTNFKC
jgi:uncharacterized protein YjdB